MGAFHTTRVLPVITDKKFGEAGLCDILIESGVVVEGSTAKVLNACDIIEPLDSISYCMRHAHVSYGINSLRGLYKGQVKNKSWRRMSIQVYCLRRKMS